MAGWRREPSGSAEPRACPAAELGVHPHTLAYRLGQMRRRFGLDLEDAETRLRIQLAVRILGT